MDRGIVLTGGGALLRGLDERLRHETGMPIHIAEDPLDSVALGSGKCVEEFEALQQVLDAAAPQLTYQTPVGGHPGHKDPPYGCCRARAAGSLPYRPRPGASTCSPSRFAGTTRGRHGRRT